MFSDKTYISRRRVLKERVGSGLIYFPGNEEVGMNYAANVYDFRQDSCFLYYFGIDRPGLVGVIDVDNDLDLLFGDDPSADEIVWTGPQVSISDLAGKSGVENSRSVKELESLFRNSSNRQIHFLYPYRERELRRLANLLDLPFSGIKAGISIELTKAIISQRSYKENQEIRELETAIETTVQMHKRAMEVARPGLYEYEVLAEIKKVAHDFGVRTSFPPIVTVNGEILHNQYFGNRLEKGDLLLVDAGADSKLHYTGDMSRTFPVDARFSEIQKNIYSIALNAHKAAANALRPGIQYKDIHSIACKEIVNGLVEMGLMTGNVDEAVSEGAHALFFQCGTGHMMGLDVHDMENLGEEFVGYTDEVIKSDQFGLCYLRLGKALETGFVLTIEPGIYFIPTLIDIWKGEQRHANFINYNEVEKLRDFGGLRTEDDYLITDSGSELLGPKLAIGIPDIEEIRARVI